MGICGSKRVVQDPTQKIVADHPQEKTIVAEVKQEPSTIRSADAVTVNLDPAIKEKIDALWVPTKLPA